MVIPMRLKSSIPDTPRPSMKKRSALHLSSVAGRRSEDQTSNPSYVVDGNQKSGKLTSWGRLVVEISLLYKVLYIHDGAGFLPSTAGIIAKKSWNHVNIFDMAILAIQLSFIGDDNHAMFPPVQCNSSTFWRYKAYNAETHQHHWLISSYC